MDNTNTIVPENRKPVKLPVAKDAWQALAFKALDHLLEEHANDYQEAKHTMPFPKGLFTTDSDMQDGDVFQRALIADTFLDSNPMMGNTLDKTIASEAKYLLGMRRKTGVGGWAYFPGLPELPPDADDLAQVMQVMLRCGYRERASLFFEKPLNVLLNEQANTDAWESWIIPRGNKTDEQQLQELWVSTAWGTGSDPEVVANLVYTLILFDEKKYAKEIERGTRFLLNIHEGKYCWKSTWYYGNYYGTYVAIRALCAAKAPENIISGAITFIENSRLLNGSWAIEGRESDALQTSLALLALSIGKLYLGQTPDTVWLETSFTYLKQTGNTQNGWQSCPFIKMPMGRPYGLIHTILTYESAAITNNYVAKACIHISTNHIL